MKYKVRKLLNVSFLFNLCRSFQLQVSQQYNSSAWRSIAQSAAAFCDFVIVVVVGRRDPKRFFLTLDISRIQAV